MRMLDLFSGAHSVGNVFKERGWDVVSLDIDPSNEPDYCIDIRHIHPSLALAKMRMFDFIWASPPCECFSVASVSKHWSYEGSPIPLPKSEEAVQARHILSSTIELIEAFKPKFWAIENPRGMMRKMKYFQDMPPVTVTYCQYGDNRMKPTDIFGILPPSWEPRKMCKRGDNCHQAAPRGSKTGTQGRKTYLERSAIPKQLIEEMSKALEEELRGKSD